MNTPISTIALDNGMQDVLDVCQTIRIECAELHHYYSDLFGNDRTVMLFWKRTALEEESSAREFAICARLWRRKAIHSFRVDPLDAQIALIYVKSVAEKYRAIPPSPADALKSSISLEEKLARFQLHNIVKFTEPSFHRLFDRVKMADRNRIISFRKAYEELEKPDPDHGFQSDSIL